MKLRDLRALRGKRIGWNCPDLTDSDHRPLTPVPSIILTGPAGMKMGLPREISRVIEDPAGWTLTPNEYDLKHNEGLPADWPQKLPAAFAPAGRLLSPEEIAGFALAFVSDEAALVNGSVLELEQYPVIGRNPIK